MCPNCFENDINKFESYTDFEEFEKLLDSKVNKGEVEFLDEEKDWDGNYICKTCYELWTLSVPDNAWRGYFLPREKAISYESRINREESISGYGCITIVVLLAIIFYLILN
ncbi:MAG: hypothetical protein COA88_03000 [Kordia sp.]|nr:MAG: hypothetical protein COA88_03000 [Kordia sp.]